MPRIAPYTRDNAWNKVVGVKKKSESKVNKKSEKVKWIEMRKKKKKKDEKWREKKVNV